MSIPSNYKGFAGKQNLMASFNNFLIETIQGGQLDPPPLQNDKEFFWAFDHPISPQDFPAITTTEIGLFNLGELALGRFLGFNKNGIECKGTKNQTLIEITCIAKDSETFTGATNLVRNLRDRVEQALTTEKIPLRDYNNPTSPQIGLIEVDRESNSINEKYLVDVTNQNIKRYVILVRVFWLSLVNQSFTDSITSDADIV